MTRIGRFVAGAQCPQCHALDRLKVDTLDAASYWCVACGYEARLSDNDPGGHEATARTEASADELTLVRLVDPHQRD